MDGLWARFRRGRTKSLSATSALVAPGPAGLPTGPPGPAQASTSAPAPAQASDTDAAPLERRIHPDLDALVANWDPPVLPVASPDDSGTANLTPAPLFPTALRPSARRHSVDGATPVRRPAPQTDTGLDDLVENPISIPFTAQPQPPPRARRLLTRLTSSATPSSSTSDVATTAAAATAGIWSTFGRRGDSSRPHLTEFGDFLSDSPAPSQGTSLSHSMSISQSQVPSQADLRTPSPTSQQLDDSVTYSTSGHDHHSTPGSDLASPSSGFTFGSHGPGRTAPSSPAPPMPPLDHPAFRRGGQSSPPSQPRTPPRAQKTRPTDRQPRTSSSLPSMHSASRPSKRRSTGTSAVARAQDIFAALTLGRPSSASAQRRASDAGIDNAESEEGSLAGSREVVAGDPDEQMSRRSSISGSGGDLRGGEDVKLFDARAKRVDGSSDTQVADPSLSVWPDIPLHSIESSASTMEQKKAGAPLVALAPPADRRRRTPSPAIVNRSSTRGKRKAEDIDRGSTSLKATDPDPPTRQASRSPAASSRTPTSSQTHKGAKPAMTPVDGPQPQSPPKPGPHSQPGSHTTSGTSRDPSHARTLSLASHAPSLPLSALVTPRAQSVAASNAHSSYFMQDPRKPPRVQPTGWSLSLDGPLKVHVHAWLFFVGFVLFPIWWVAGLCVPVPRTRRLGGSGDAEKGAGAGTAQVVLDDPQVEFDARTWRKRCRIMAGLSLVTYVPFIVLLAVFLSRGT